MLFQHVQTRASLIYRTEPTTKKWKKNREKNKKQKTDMLRSIAVNSAGNAWSQCWRRKGMSSTYESDTVQCKVIGVVTLAPPGGPRPSAPAVRIVSTRGTMEVCETAGTERRRLRQRAERGRQDRYATDSAATTTGIIRASLATPMATDNRRQLRRRCDPRISRLHPSRPAVSVTVTCLRSRSLARPAARPLSTPRHVHRTPGNSQGIFLHAPRGGVDR